MYVYIIMFMCTFTGVNNWVVVLRMCSTTRSFYDLAAMHTYLDNRGTNIQDLRQVLVLVPTTYMGPRTFAFGIKFRSPIA